MSIRPLRDLVAVRVDEPKKQTDGGVLIPAAHQGSSSTGTVLSVGPGETVKGELKPIDLRPGDRIMFARGVGTRIERDGEVTHLIPARDVLGRL
jgi:chaperonin GroES